MLYSKVGKPYTIGVVDIFLFDLDKEYTDTSSRIDSRVHIKRRNFCFLYSPNSRHLGNLDNVSTRTEKTTKHNIRNPIISTLQTTWFVQAETSDMYFHEAVK